MIDISIVGNFFSRIVLNFITDLCSNKSKCMLDKSEPLSLHDFLFASPKPPLSVLNANQIIRLILDQSNGLDPQLVVLVLATVAC